MPCFRKGRVYENAAIIASATGSSELCADQRGANPRSFHALSGIPGARLERIYKSREFRSRDGSVGPYYPDSAGDCRIVFEQGPDLQFETDFEENGPLPGCSRDRDRSYRDRWSSCLPVCWSTERFSG